MKLTKCISALTALTLFAGTLTGCRDENKHDFTFTEPSLAVGDALSGEYEHLKLSGDFEIDIPEHIYEYDVDTDAPVRELLSGDKFERFISLMFSPDDFDKDKNPDDEITKGTHYGQEGTLICENKTKHIYAGVNDNGYACLEKRYYLRPGEDEEYSGVAGEIFFVNRKGLSEEQEHVLASAQQFADKATEVYGAGRLVPAALQKFSPSDGNEYYTVYLTQELSQGAKSNLQGIATFEEILFAGNDARMELSPEGEVYMFYCDCIINTKQGKEMTKIVTLSDALRYVDEELAPNMELKVKSVDLIYARKNEDKKYIPVWDIEIESMGFDDDINDLYMYERIYVDAQTGTAYTYFDDTINVVD